MLKELVARRTLRIVGAVYSLDTGKVDWVPVASGSVRLENNKTCLEAVSSH